MTNVFEGSDGEVGAPVETPMGHDPVKPALPTEEEQREFETLLDAFRRWEGSGPIPLQIGDRRTAWILMGALQLAWRHPTSPFKDDLQAFARQIQDAICDTKEIYELAEAGWNPERDR